MLDELLSLYLRSSESYTELIFSSGQGDFAIEATVGSARAERDRTNPPAPPFEH